MYPGAQWNLHSLPYLELVALQDAGVTESPLESTGSGRHVTASI